MEVATRPAEAVPEFLEPPIGERSHDQPIMQTETLDQVVQRRHQVLGLQIDDEGRLREGQDRLLEGGHPDAAASIDAAIDAHMPVSGIQTGELVES